MKYNFFVSISILFFGTSFSQTPISLELAIQKALENNLSIKDKTLRTEYQKKLQNSNTIIEPLVVSGELGQMNSAYIDHQFSVSQSIRLPKFYKSQKKVMIEEYKKSLLHVELQKWELKKEISLIYNNLKHIDEKKKLLEKAKKIFSDYVLRANLRLQKGESNILEKASAENLRSQAEIQLLELEKDQKIALQKFNFLINDTPIYINDHDHYSILSLGKIEKEFMGNPTIIQQLEQEKNIQNAILIAEKSKLSPIFSIGYNNMTMYGTGADNQFYNRNARFQSGTVGIGIPIFNSAQKSVIEAQKINQVIAENNFHLVTSQLKNTYQQLKFLYEKLNAELSYYQEKGLENSQLILQAADQQFLEGEIHYMEWSLLVNQALEIENKYLDTIHEINQTIIEINSLTQE